MPQPLSSIDPTFGASAWGADATIKRPNLAAMALDVIATWSFADFHLMQILGIFLKWDVELAAVILDDLGPDARQAAIYRAAKAMLPTQALLIQAAISSTKTSRTRRNHFAHHMWGICDEPGLEDALLLVDPKDFNKEHTKLVGALVRRKPLKTAYPGVVWDNSKWFVYKEKDFVDSLESARRAKNIMYQLYDLIFPLTVKDRSDSIRAELEADPLIQRETERLSRQT